MFQAKLFTVIAHLVGWLLIFGLLQVSLLTPVHSENIVSKILSPQSLLFYFVFVFLFYFNTYVLVPQFYLQKKYASYFVIILTLFVIVSFLQPYDQVITQGHRFAERSVPSLRFPSDRSFPARPPRRIDIISCILFIMIWSLSTVICIIQQWRLTEQRAARAEADKANAELSFLKAQINPHFLFNTLNNIYALAVIKSEDTAAAVMKLSKIMRYITDEATQDYVSLQSEVDCISDYIDLQRIRSGKKLSIDFSVGGSLEDKKIAPLVLITFIENVFKYGISSHEQSHITIKLLSEENRISFLCKNKIFASSRIDEGTGIGIANTKQRLDYLYPNKHLLNIKKENGMYIVHLTLHV